jgi:peptidoglycan/xylan/chitin deacetylase (PgdA/CDA1 family)/glycosyltransferase involved in cell wall biosynthesis
VFHKVPQVCSPFSTNELDLATFERVLDTARRLFHIIPLEDAVLALRAGNLPARAACITFDDGYADWLNGVVPVLERHGLHATFFIATGQFFGVPMWNERILHAVAHAPAALQWLEVPGLALPRLALNNVADKKQVIAQLDQLLKYKEPMARERILQDLERLTGADIAAVPTMPAADLKSIHHKGFGIGSHTVLHPILARCTPELALQEMVQAREQLEALINRKVTGFAYPNGAPGKDFGPEHIEMVKQAGYSWAVTTRKGVANSNSSVFQIPRFTPWGPSAAKMELQLGRNLLQPPQVLPEPETVAALPQKRVLMVAFHFPPQAGSSGVLRTLNFVKHLPKSGWAPTVLTANARVYSEQRNDLVASIPPRTRVLRAFAFDASRHFAVSGKYLRTLALPDRWSTWWFGAVIVGLLEIRRQRPDVIWSTYPITTAHLIGGALAHLTGIPWVADFRDPMVSADYPSDKLQRKIWKRLEAYFLRNASQCVFTTERAAKAYGERYPEAANKCVVIENGYDEEAFTGVQPNRFGTPPDTLLLLHSGLIYPQDRNPSTFFAAVQGLIHSGELDRGRLCIRFRAPHHGDEVRAFAAAYGLEDVVDIAPAVPYQEAIAEMMAADLLLVFQGSYFNAQIPAKIYEYVRAQRPVLAVLDPAGDTAMQLHQFEEVYFGDIASQGDIQIALSQWLNGRGCSAQVAAYARNFVAVKKYSRVAQSMCLTEVLHKFEDLKL